MATTKTKKKTILNEAQEELKEAKTLLFADFSGVKTEDLRSLRRALASSNATFEVIKKRLLKIAFRSANLDYDPLQFDSQVGTIFAKGDLTEAAGALYRFSKDNNRFKILGGLDVAKGESLSGETVISIGKLPPREVLLGQLVGMLAAPIRMFLYVLSERSKQAEN